MKELAQVKEEIKSILDSHNDNLSSMFNIHNAKLSKAKEGVEIGKYQRAYYDGLLNNAKDSSYKLSILTNRLCSKPNKLIIKSDDSSFL